MCSKDSSQLEQMMLHGNVKLTIRFLIVPMEWLTFHREDLSVLDVSIDSWNDLVRDLLTV